MKEKPSLRGASGGGGSLRAALRDLRHDLGKYITFETRFVEDPDDQDALREALRIDLTETHRRGDEVEAAWEVWARLRPAGLEHWPEIPALDGLLARLSRVDLSDPETDLLLVARDTAAVAGLTRRLAARLGPED